MGSRVATYAGFLDREKRGKNEANRLAQTCRLEEAVQDDSGAGRGGERHPDGLGLADGGNELDEGHG